MASFFEARWAATDEHPGLESAANAELTPATGQEILALRGAVAEAEIEHRILPGRPALPAPEARRALRAILATLAWHLDSGDDAEARAALDALRAAHAEGGRSARALAAALEGAARLAAIHRAAITGLGGFAPERIEEARALARTLRDAAASGRAPPPAAQEALALRNKLVALLRERIATVRAAARFVFRDDPEIIREVTSAHERKRRRRGRAGKSKISERSSSPGGPASPGRP